MSTHHSNLRLVEANRKLAHSCLKVCPLCDALNSAENKECFVCTWHGEFVHDPQEIEQGLVRLIRSCPSFLAQGLDLPEYTARAPRWRFLLRRVLRGPLDYRI